MTHHEYRRLTNTNVGLTPTTYFLSVRFWRLSKVSIPVLGCGTLPTPGVFRRKVWNIQSPSMSPLSPTLISCKIREVVLVLILRSCSRYSLATSEDFWDLHKDLFFDFSVEKCSGYIHLMHDHPVIRGEGSHQPN